jgi:hypothetical protein
MCQIIFSLAWNALLHRLTSVQLSPGTNEFRWNLHANENFSLDSMYKALILSEIPIENNKMIWKMKIPLKIIFFGWYLRRGVILIKDYLVRRNWQGSTKCVFYHEDETIKHLFSMPVCQIYMVNHPNSIQYVSITL